MKNIKVYSTRLTCSVKVKLYPPEREGFVFHYSRAFNNSSMSAEEAEVLYHPSKWNKRYPVDVIVGEHIKWIENVSREVTNTVPHTTVRYDDGDKTKLDIFGTDLPSESLVLMYVHGGYWQEKAIGRENSAFIAKSLYAKKIKTIIVGYDLCPEVTLERIVQQIQKAFKYCVDYCKQQGSKGLLLAGHSAGAHLVASLFQGYFEKLPETERKTVKAALLIGGIYNLVPLVEIPSVNDPLKLTKAEAERLSPLLQTLTATKDVAFYVIVAENESPAFIEQAKELKEKLKTAGCVVNFVEIANTDHFDIVEKITDVNFEITKIVLEYNK